MGRGAIDHVDDLRTANGTRRAKDKQGEPSLSDREFFGGAVFNPFVPRNGHPATIRDLSRPFGVREASGNASRFVGDSNIVIAGAQLSGDLMPADALVKEDDERFRPRSGVRSGSLLRSLPARSHSPTRGPQTSHRP